MQDSFRKSSITLPLPGPLAVGNAQVTFTSYRNLRLTRLQLCLSGSGTGAGATNVNVNQNGTAINAANALSIAGAAGTPNVATQLNTGNSYPGGDRINKGDVITVDITSVPATTQPKGGFVVLDVIELDV